jgi:hypothetical protein
VGRQLGQRVVLEVEHLELLEAGDLRRQRGEPVVAQV